MSSSQVRTGGSESVESSSSGRPRMSPLQVLHMLMANGKNRVVIRRFVAGSAILWALPFAVFFFLRMWFFPVFLQWPVERSDVKSAMDTWCMVAVLISTNLVIVGYIVMALKEKDERQDPAYTEEPSSSSRSTRPALSASANASGSEVVASESRRRNTGTSSRGPSRGKKN